MLTLDPAALRPWLVDKGEHGNDGALFSEQEYDGFIVITPSVGVAIHLPWHVLPKAAAAMTTTVAPPPGVFQGTGTLRNQSALVSGQTAVFDLVDQDPNDYNYTVGDCSALDLEAGCNTTVLDLKDIGMRALVVDDDIVQNDLVLEFAVTLWDKPYRSAQKPGEFDIYIDRDLDGTDDYEIYTADKGDGTGQVDGRNVVYVWDYFTDQRTPYTYTFADFNSQNTILRVPVAAVGVVAGQKFGFAVSVYDVYFSNQEKDSRAVHQWQLFGLLYLYGGPTRLCHHRRGTILCHRAWCHQRLYLSMVNRRGQRLALADRFALFAQCRGWGANPRLCD